MILPAITLLALVAGVQSQERFFNNPLVTVTRTTVTTTTSTLIPTCFEVVSTTQCARKKKQLAYLVNPFDYRFDGIMPQVVVPIQISAAPAPAPYFGGYRFYQPQYYNVLPSQLPQLPIQQQFETKPTIDSSLSDDSEDKARFLFTNMIKFTYSTSTVTVPTVASNTQTLQVNCLAIGQSKPSNTCIIRITFPAVPAGTTLQAYCQSLADAAKMALAECKTVSRRRRATTSPKVIVGFTEKVGGEPASRKSVSANIAAACQFKQACTLGGATFDLNQVEVPGFTNILEAGGSSSKYTSTK